MSRKPEQLLWARLRPKFLAAGLYVERVENSAGAGKPDVDTLWRGGYMPIELKMVRDWPALPTTPVLGKRGLRQSQLNWFLNWRRHNGRALIVVGVAREVFTFSEAVSEEINSFPTPTFKARAIAVGISDLITIIKEQA